MKKIGIYDRYLSTAGGGERYSCKIAEVLSEQKEFSVDLITDIFADLKEISGKLNLDLDRVNLNIFPFISGDYAEKITRKYDLFINATYLSSLHAYGKKNIYLCYFPTPFDIDFKFIHRFLLFFLRIPAAWLFRFSDKLLGGFNEVEIIEGLYEPKRFMLGRGSWSSGRVVLIVKKTGIPLKLGFKNPKVSGLDQMNVSIDVLGTGPGDKNLLYNRQIRLPKGVKRIVEIPANFNRKYYKVLISSGTFVPLDTGSDSRDSRKLGVAVYDCRKMKFFKRILLKIFGYIPLFLITFPRNLKFLETYHKIIAISEYSKKWIEKLWGKKSTVLFPPVDIDNFKTAAKEKIILSVGRFFPEHHNKKQLELAIVFKEMLEMYPDYMKGYTLYLVGGVDRKPDHLDYVEKIRAVSRDCPIKIITNIEWVKLVELFARSYIFWHASGMGEDEKTHPEKFEHFGITTVEAMAAGCIPVVISEGGQREIISNGHDGFLFKNWQELKAITLDIIRGKVDIKGIKENAAKSCRRFSNLNFKRNLLLIVGNLIKKETGNKQPVV